MPDESDLKNLFSQASAPNTLDADRIIAKARKRRAPKQVVAGVGGALALAGIFVVAINTAQFGAQPPSAISTLTDASDSAGSAPEAETLVKRMPAERLNLCGAPLTEFAPSAYGLQLDVVFPTTAPVGTAPIEGTVRLTNTSSTRVMGTTAAVPAITVARDGIVQWHSNGPMIMSLVVVDLEPGQSLEYAASVTPVQCSAEDDAAEVFRPDLPALAAGNYELSAAIDFTPDPSLVTDGYTELDLVTGPRSPITLG